MYHDHEMAGHPGELETYNGIRQNLLDFGMLKTKRSTVYTLVFVAKRFARNAEEETLYIK
jgi:hypothetical protein